MNELIGWSWTVATRSYNTLSHIITKSTTFNRGIDRNIPAAIHHAKRFPYSNDTNHIKSYPLAITCTIIVPIEWRYDSTSTREYWKGRNDEHNRFNYQLMHFSSCLFLISRFRWLSFGRLNIEHATINVERHTTFIRGKQMIILRAKNALSTKILK